MSQKSIILLTIKEKIVIIAFAKWENMFSISSLLCKNRANSPKGVQSK